MKRISVNLGSRSYDILIEAGLLHHVSDHISPYLNKSQQIFVITDHHVDRLHGSTLKKSLEGFSYQWLSVCPGEFSKSLNQFSQLVEDILRFGPERHDLIIAFGGGVIGDLAGYVAASVLRGLNFIQIPTTLLAQVDSSVGGKTGLNSIHGKNLIGAFYQPKLVLVDLDVLESLPEREMKAGYAEIVKYALIDQPDFFEWLEHHGRNILARTSDMSEAIAKSCLSKARIVAEDEREAGHRALLNLGHTFAHAFESVNLYDGRILHGEAVSVGLVCAHRLSCDLGFAAEQDLARLVRHLLTLDMPVDLTRFDTGQFSLPMLLKAMAKDKKAQKGHLRFILTRGIGKAFISEGVDQKAVEKVLERVGFK